MKKFVCPVLFLLSSLLQAQPVNVDSLVSLLNMQELDSEKTIQLYWDITLGYRNNDINKTYLYAKKGLNLSEQEHNDLWCARFSRILGFNYIQTSEYDSSFLRLQNAIAFADKADDKREENIATAYLGTLHLQQGKYEQALKYFTDVLPSLESLQQNEHYANTLLNVAIAYKSLRNSDKALEYCEKAVEIAEKNNLPYPKMVSLEVKGDIYYAKHQYDSTMVYMLKAYEIAHQRKDKSRLVTETQILAIVYAYMGEYDKAEKYANECLELANELGGRYQLFMAWSAMVQLKFRQKQYKESESYADKMWKTDSTELFWAMNTTYYLCHTNIILNNSQKAGYFFDKYTEIRDKISDKELYDSLADMEVKYETEKKEIRIAALEEKQKLYIGLGVVIVVALLLGMGLLFYRHRSKRKLAEQQIKQLEQEKELIAARSALDAEKAEREIIARDLHDGVGAMLSVVKNNMSIMKSYSVIENKETDHFNKALDGLDKSIAELRRVAHHIMPAVLMEKGLFAALDDFCRSIPEAEFHFTEPERRFVPEKELVLYRCAYELVSNALRHAKATRIEVHLNMDEEMVYLSVVDNGCGFDQQTTSMGMGINNMRTRLAAFGGRIDIYSEIGNGTEANVELKM